MVGGDDPFYLKFWTKLTHSFKNADIQSIFTGSKKIQFTNSKSTTHFSISLR